MSKQSLLRPSVIERKEFKKDKNDGLRFFLENRLLNNVFTENIGLDNLRIAACKLYKGSGSKFQDIWDDTMTLVENVKSTNTEEYGEKWTRIIRKHSDDGYEDLRFYCEALMLNRMIEGSSNDKKGRVDYTYDAGLIYNLEYLDPPLDNKQFYDVWHKIECRIQYLNGNNLGPCFCIEHRESEKTKLYDMKAQDKIYQDFMDNDVPRVHMLYSLEDLFETRIRTDSVEHIGKLFLDHNNECTCLINIGNECKLSLHTLNCIWEVALNRASEYALKKIIINRNYLGQCKCEYCGEDDIDKLDIYTEDGKRVLGMTEEDFSDNE
jgi:hypothetical protein